MKKTLLALVILFLLSGHSFADPPEVERLKERILTLRNWQLMEALDIEGKRAEEVFKILERFDRKRERLILRRKALLRELRELSQNGSVDRIRKTIDSLLKIDYDLLKVKEQELKALSGVLSPVEQARYFLFSERFRKELPFLIKRKRAGSRW